MTATLTPTRLTAPASASKQSIMPDVMRSEWTKLRSVRSTYWTLLIAVVGIIGISALISAIYVAQYSGVSAKDRATFNPTVFSLNGVIIAQLAIGVLGVLIITSEYSTGMIRSTLAAVPQRRTMLAAKASVFAAVTAVVGIVSCFVAFFIGQAILSSKGIEAHLGDPGVLRSIIGAGLYLPILGLLALGIGTLIRHSAGAISAFFGVLFVVPTLVALLPGSWGNTIGKYLPGSAGQAITGSNSASSSLSPWVGFGVFCLWAVAVLVAGAVMLQRRDA
jgi:ABC-2 type transport system permease protein